jgi:probable HAF family extracellular repeat protein
LGGPLAKGWGINNHGVVVGDSLLVDGVTDHAFLWNGAAMTDLNDFLDATTIGEGWILTIANGINDNGWIAGQAYNTLTGQYHAYLLAVPVPEPETYGMLLAGLGLIAAVLRRKTLQ